LENPRAQTILVITHRLVGMENMDEILVMEAGQIVQRGGHKMLIEQDGLYRQMWLAQNQMLFEAGELNQDYDQVK
jgi:ABC-type transport system involved in Fe-S cluster assembly fused permease/ATPase subunit